MGFASGETFGRERTEVLHVVGDQRTALGCSCFENHPIVLAGDVTAVYYGFDVTTAAPEQLRDARRELLVEQSLHPRSARSPAAAASSPRWYSASLSSISASISSWCSP
jgi:hypothetical protein